MIQVVTPKVLAAVAALSITAAPAFAAAPVAAPAKAAPVKMSDQKLDRVSAGTTRTSGTRFTAICSFGNNCSGNGGSYNGNSAGLINVANGTLAGSAVLSGNSVRLW